MIDFLRCLTSVYILCVLNIVFGFQRLSVKLRVCVSASICVIFCLRANCFISCLHARALVLRLQIDLTFQELSKKRAQH